MLACNTPIIFDSNTDGPTITIVALTHGNEIIGLDVFESLITDFDIRSLIKKGKIIFICSNLEAHKKFLSQDNPLKYRYLDHDMNRIWNDTYEIGSYEYSRREELKKILNWSDVVIDIHSVSKWDDILWIVWKNNYKESLLFIDAQRILIENSDTYSMRNWIEKQWKKSFWIEAWNHISKNGIASAITTILNLLSEYGMISYQKRFHHMSPKILEFIEEIKPISEKFHYAREFNNWDILWENEIFAEDGDILYRNTYSWNICIGLVQKEIQYKRWAGFLFREIL